MSTLAETCLIIAWSNSLRACVLAMTTSSLAKDLAWGHDAPAGLTATSTPALTAKILSIPASTHHRATPGRDRRPACNVVAATGGLSRQGGQGTGRRPERGHGASAASGGPQPALDRPGAHWQDNGEARQLRWLAECEFRNGDHQPKPCTDAGGSAGPDRRCKCVGQRMALGRVGVEGVASAAREQLWAEPSRRRPRSKIAGWG
jgi:hypothetical protein